MLAGAESKRHLAVPAESCWIEQRPRGSSEARSAGIVRGLEAEAIYQYAEEYFNISSTRVLYLHIPAGWLASCTQLSQETLLVTHRVRADDWVESPGRHHSVVRVPRKLPPWE